MDANRRNLVKGIGVAAIGGGALGATILQSNTAAAASFNFTATNAKVTTVDGTVSELTIDPSGQTEWSGFDTEISQIKATIHSKVNGTTSMEEVDSWTFGVPEPGNTGSYAYGGGEPIPLYSGSRANELFGSDPDGSTRQRIVTVSLQVELLDASGNRVKPESECVQSDTAEFTVDVTNQAASSSGSAEGDTDIN